MSRIALIFWLVLAALGLLLLGTTEPVYPVG